MRASRPLLLANEPVRARFPQATIDFMFLDEAWTFTKKLPVMGTGSAGLAVRLALPFPSTPSVALNHRQVLVSPICSALTPVYVPRVLSAVRDGVRDLHRTLESDRRLGDPSHPALTSYLHDAGQLRAAS